MKKDVVKLDKLMADSLHKMVPYQRMMTAKEEKLNTIKRLENMIHYNDLKELANKGDK